MASGAMDRLRRLFLLFRHADWTRGSGRPVAFVLSILLIAVLAADPEPVRLARERVFDAYQQIHPRDSSGSQVVIVEIDEVSLDREGQWPWPRARLARLIDRIADAGPRMIGVDLLFADPDRHSPENALADWQIDDPVLRSRLDAWIASHPGNDTILAESLRLAPPTLISTLGFDPEPDFTPPAAAADEAAPSILSKVLARHATIVEPLAEIRRSASGTALANIVPDSDGTVRRVPLLFWAMNSVQSSFALEAFRLGLGARSFTLAGNDHGLSAIRLAPHGVEIDTEFDGTIRPYFARSDRPALALAGDVPRTMMASGVLQQANGPQGLRNRWVLVGLSDPLLANEWLTPLGERLSGVLLQAEILENLIDDAWLRRPAWARWLELATAAAFTLLLIVLVPASAKGRSAAITLGTAIGLVLLGFLVFRTSGHLLDGTAPAITGLAAFVVLTSAGYAIAMRQRRAIDAELNIARRVQQGILPAADDFASLAERLEVRAHLEPARTVGGDFHDCIRLPGNRVLFHVTDVSGKGIDAAIFMALAKSLMRSLAFRLERPTAGRFLGESLRELDRAHDADTFVAMACCIVDLDGGCMDVAIAGHPPPLLLRSGAVRILRDAAPGPPPGLDRNEICENARIDLKSGDVVLIVTDGVLEAFDDGTGRSVERLAEIVEGAPAGCGAGGLVDYLRSRPGSVTACPPADDRTFLAFSLTGRANLRE
ncbi:MAG: CHASE2 domain-containing protein [Geminicoccaceae bacterium]|nr:CHASE2 domain-containing protein [Geminicoccaceae bacterium]